MIDFWATWCGPCQVMGPLVDTVASEYEGKVKVLKLNVDQNPVTPSKYGVRGIPTLILFKDGKPVKKIIGVRTKGDLEREFELA